jgi:hypothetical protein
MLRVAKAPKRDVETAHKTEAAVAVRQYSFVLAHDYARERKKIAERLRKEMAEQIRKTQNAFDKESSLVLAAKDNPGDIVVAVQCPKCALELTPLQIEAGFVENRLDYRTTCPECLFRFETSFAFTRDGASARFVWLCPEQTRDQFEDWLSEPATEDDAFEYIEHRLLRDRPEVFFNAYRHSDAKDGSVVDRVCQFLDILQIK